MNLTNETKPRPSAGNRIVTVNRLGPDAAEVARVLNGRRSGRGYVCRCPNARAHAHRDRSPSLSVSDGRNGGIVFHCFSPACNRRDVFDEFRSRGLIVEAPQGETRCRILQPSTPATAPDYNVAKRQRLAQAIWREGRDPRGTLAEAYLNGRDLPLFDKVAAPVIRFHPALWLDEDRQSVPGLIAAFRPIVGDVDPGAPPAAIHRIFLNPDGSAIRDEHGKRIKKMLGPSKGCAIKLSADEDVEAGLGIVEGIEDGLGRLATGWAPVWTLGSAQGLAQFPVLPGIGCLTIFADHDPRGQGLAAAKVCSDRWRGAGVEVVTRIRTKTGDDWADGEGEQ